MKIKKNRLYILLIGIFFIVVLGVAYLINHTSTSNKKAAFQLIDCVEEAPVAYHADFRAMWEELCYFNRHIDNPLGPKFLYEQVEKLMIGSGLNLSSVYITLHQLPNPTVVFYAKIVKPKKFDSTFKELSFYYDFIPINSDSSRFYSKKVNLSIEKHKQFVKIYSGRRHSRTDSKDSFVSTSFFRKQLKKIGAGIINTTGSHQLDSTDFATFSYTLDSTLSFAIDWTVQKNHPIVKEKNELPFYPSQKSVFKAGITMDLDALKNYQNPYLAKKFKKLLGSHQEQLKEFFNAWNGSFSIQAGGTSIREHKQTVTEFGENFNQVERTVVRKDSFPDIGMYINTKMELHQFIQLIERFPNMKVNENKIQIAYMPSLLVKQQKEGVQLSVGSKKYINTRMNTIAFAKWKNSFFHSKCSIIESKGNTVQFKFHINKINELPQEDELQRLLVW